MYLLSSFGYKVIFASPKIETAFEREEDLSMCTHFAFSCSSLSTALLERSNANSKTSYLHLFSDALLPLQVQSPGFRSREIETQWSLHNPLFFRGKAHGLSVLDISIFGLALDQMAMYFGGNTKT